MKHPSNVENYSGSLVELARDVGRMRYKEVAVFYGHLGDDLIEQSRADLLRGNVQLARKLESTAKKIYEARDNMIDIWNLCERYMK